MTKSHGVSARRGQAGDMVLLLEGVFNDKVPQSSYRKGGKLESYDAVAKGGDHSLSSDLTSLD